MTAKLAIRLVCTNHHCESIPAHERGKSFLNLKVARKCWLVFKSDGVSVGGVGSFCLADAEDPRLVL